MYYIVDHACITSYRSKNTDGKKKGKYPHICDFILGN